MSRISLVSLRCGWAWSIHWPGKVHQVLEIVRCAEGLRLEARHLAGGRRRVVLGPAAHDGSHGGTDTEAFGVVDIFIACQAAVDRLPQQRRQGVLGVLPGPGILQATRRRAGQPEGVIEFPIGEESGVTGDGRAVELQLDLAVEVNAQGVIVAVTHWVPLSFRQEVVGNAGFSREKAQTPCRNDRAIWEIRGERSAHTFIHSVDRPTVLSTAGRRADDPKGAGERPASDLRAPLATFSGSGKV
jgi:hypothetical protein